MMIQSDNVSINTEPNYNNNIDYFEDNNYNSQTNVNDLKYVKVKALSEFKDQQIN